MHISVKQFLIGTSLLVLASCQDVIDVDLNSSNPRYVIEGEINNSAGPYYVHITRSKNFDEDNNFPVVDDAMVTVTDVEEDITERLQFVDGVYQTSSLTGEPGHTYHLEVRTADQVFTASSTIPEQVIGIDSLYIGSSEWDASEFFATATYMDPEGKGNYYRFRQWINGRLMGLSIVTNDDFNDGRLNTLILEYDIEEESGRPPIQTGDHIQVEMQCIDKGVYDYYRTLENASGGDGGGWHSPANPVGNINGGALGVFNACSHSFKEIRAE